MRTAHALAALLCATVFAIASCSHSGGEDNVPGAIATRAVSGTVSLPQGTPIDLATLDVVSFADASPVSGSGSFTVLVPDTDLPQTLFVMGAGPSPVLACSVGPGDVDGVVVDATSTATALAMLNPFLTLLSADDRASLAVSLRQHNGWNSFVAAVRSAVASSSTGRLSDTAEPNLLQMAARIVLDTLAGNPGGEMPLAWPWLDDVPGDGVACVNPGAVFYGFRAVSEDGERTVTAVVGSDRAGLRALPSWPPAADPTGSTTTTVDLGDGTFDAGFVRSDFRALGSDTPEGLAAVENCARGVVELLAPLSGVLAERQAADLGVASWAIGDLAAAAAARDPHAFMLEIAALVAEHADGVSAWYWQGDNAVCEDFVSAACPLVRGAVFSSQVLTAGDPRVPFFGDLLVLGAPGSQRIRQLDGVMTLTASQVAPRAAFVHSPSFATAGSPVSFDATSCADPDGPSDRLEVRWDWESDGTWDTGWTQDRAASHAFAARGTYETTLEVRDGDGLADAVVHRVNVGGGEGTAAHVVVLRDVVPWSPEVPPVLDLMLQALGMTEGAGAGRYEVKTSADLPGLTLTPGEDLLIVQNDQPQTFYNAYGRNQVKVLQFVAAGGTVFWEACDLGWSGGSIQAARIAWPGGIEFRSYPTWVNNVVLRGAPIVEGLPEQVYGQYASHEGIENLPDGASVYMRDDGGSPTLVEFGYGDGWVVLTTQPLEWNFYHNWTCGLVMPNVVCYVLGLPLVHDFGDIVKPSERGRPASFGGATGPTSGKR
jgi:hypothetical protein